MHSYSEMLDKKENSTLNYQQLLSTTDWQKRREEIINRDSKRCTKCKLSPTGPSAHYDAEFKTHTYLTDDGTEKVNNYISSINAKVGESIPNMTVVDKPYHLQVHHKYYVLNSLPWDYPDDALVTLCNWCHTETHQNEKILMYLDTTKTAARELISCNRCHGAGWFSQYNHVQNGVCFKCEGRRFKTELINY